MNHLIHFLNYCQNITQIYAASEFIPKVSSQSLVTLLDCMHPISKMDSFESSNDFRLGLLLHFRYSSRPNYHLF